MKFRLRGRVNYLPVATFRKLTDNYAEADLSAEKIKENDVKDIYLSEGLNILTEGEEFENIVKIASAVETGMEALNIDTKAMKDSLSGDIVSEGVTKAKSSGIIEAAMEEAGIALKVFVTDKEAKIKEPVKINYRPDSGSIVENHIIYLREGSSLTLIQMFESEDEENNLVGIRTRVYVEKNASIKLVKVNLLGNKTDRFDDMGFYLSDDTEAELVELELGGNRVYAGVRTELVGRRSRYLSDTGYLCRGESLLDMNFITNHLGKASSCNMDASGVLMDSATKVYRGSIDFKEGAKGARGFETEETLHFSPNVINKSVPLILCHEDDVEGDHGATIGRLDDALLFYINSRGIDAEAAKELMTMARINAVTNKIEDEETVDRVRQYVSEVFNGEK